VSLDFTGLCREHSFESATALCRRCGLEYCEDCVVYPFGAKKPVCKTCAITMSGVRSQAGLRAMPPRLVKKRAKAFAKKIVGSAGGRPATSSVDEEHVVESDHAPDSDDATPIDWSQPFD